MRLRAAALFLAAVSMTLTVAGCDAKEGIGTPDIPERDGLEVGTEAPEFRLKNQEQQTVVLSDYRETSNVILVFYPADFTPV